MTILEQMTANEVCPKCEATGIKHIELKSIKAGTFVDTYSYKCKDCNEEFMTRG